MIRLSREEQRDSPDRFGEALGDWLRGERTPSAEAAGQHVAEILIRIRQRLEAGG